MPHACFEPGAFDVPGSLVSPASGLLTPSCRTNVNPLKLEYILNEVSEMGGEGEGGHASTTSHSEIPLET
jgi:hypothetical protein